MHLLHKQHPAYCDYIVNITNGCSQYKQIISKKNKTGEIWCNDLKIYIAMRNLYCSVKVKENLEQYAGGNLFRNLEWTLSIKQLNSAVVGDQTTSQ